MGLLDGKVAIVTGGGTGIGRAVSLDLARAGAKVVVNDYGVSVDGTDPSSAPANEVVTTIRSAGGQAVASPESVATMAGGRGLVELALKEFGDLHIVVCCAGILRERMIFNMSEEEWDAVIAVHLKGHFTVMQPATRHMREKRAGSIITFTSTAGLEGSPGQPNYSAAKEGIVGLTRSTALAMARYGERSRRSHHGTDRGRARHRGDDLLTPGSAAHGHQRRAVVSRATGRGVGPRPRPGPTPALRRLADHVAAQAGVIRPALTPCRSRRSRGSARR
jgi:NAD(P)-dependent dehydrogenase (short-subunit alcohol dehydrogenase family)